MAASYNRPILASWLLADVTAVLRRLNGTQPVTESALSVIVTKILLHIECFYCRGQIHLPNWQKLAAVFSTVFEGDCYQTVS